MTSGQALHLGGNEPPTLAMIYSNRFSEDRDGSAGQLGVQGHEDKWGRDFQSLQVAWEMRDNSPHMDGCSGTGTVEHWPVFPKWPAGFPLLVYRHRGVPPPPLSFELPHSFGYFKLVVRL